MRKLVLSLFLTASLGCMAQYDEVILQWRDSVRLATNDVYEGTCAHTTVGDYYVAVCRTSVGG